jgi:hypothetical protein
MHRIDLRLDALGQGVVKGVQINLDEAGGLSIRLPPADRLRLLVVGDLKPGEALG